MELSEAEEELKEVNNQLTLYMRKKELYKALLKRRVL